MDIAFVRFDSARLCSLEYLARTCLWRKAWTVCELQRSSEWYRRHGMMSTSDSQNQKSHTTVKRCLAAMAKQNKEACLITRACAGVNLKKNCRLRGI